MRDDVFSLPADVRERTAQHMFEVLGQLRGCALKGAEQLRVLGQALPPDLAGPYRVALARLQESAPSMLPSVVHQVLARGLGDDWRTLFREFDDRRPVAASAGQVHRAVWWDGRRVAVKVQYPSARRLFRRDLAQLARLWRLASALIGRAEGWEVVETISEQIGEELDYAREARNQRAFAAAFDGDPDFVVPAVVAQAGDVLVGEWVAGTPVTRLIAAGERADRDRAGLLMLRFGFAGPGRCGLMHGDPSPGNARLLPDGRLGVLDFGACAPVPPDLRRDLAELLAALAGDAPGAWTDALRARRFLAPDADPAAAQRVVRDVFAFLRDDEFAFSDRRLRRAVRAVDVRGLRGFGVPARFARVWWTLLGAVGVLSRLEASGPFRGELARLGGAR
ncbi:ABC1 kinase family protein [Actinomadura atramentaria]|uniref:ABC1 kinase family protein n=1 Tax=Actinomadura atramentaria TaxID=1990 RepID=UPI00037D0855|nr:AarF/ABC1/UbiB kinase family protein [Actinomadura atramentaria]